MQEEISTPTQQVLDQLRPRLRSHYLDTPEPAAMIEIALALLIEGVETPAVLRCACMSPIDDRDDIRDGFYEALAELGIPKMTVNDAAREEIRYLAPMILAADDQERQRAIDRIRGLFEFDDYVYPESVSPEQTLWFACWHSDDGRADQGLDIDECASAVSRSSD